MQSGATCIWKARDLRGWPTKTRHGSEYKPDSCILSNQLLSSNYGLILTPFANIILAPRNFEEAPHASILNLQNPFQEYQANSME